MSTSGSDCIINMGNGSLQVEDEEACIAKLLQEALLHDSDQPQTTTLSRGRESNTSTPDNAKRRVDLATPSLIRKRCLVTQLDELNGLEYAYCLPRSASDTLLDRLEYYWNQKWNTLNVDTRFNIFCLSATFHRLFLEKNRWLLVPEPHIVEEYYISLLLDRFYFPEIKKDSFKYTLFSTNLMATVPIHRQTLPIAETDSQMGSPTPPTPLGADAFTLHTHPYTTLGHLQSHIHPTFVIFNAGMKLAQMDKATLCEFLPNDRVLLCKIIKIYTKWTRPLDESRPDVQSFFQGRTRVTDDGIASCTSQLTATKRLIPNRMTHYYSRKRYRKHGKRPVSGDAVWLDDETLRELDPVEPSPRRAWKNKKTWIRRWVEHVEESSPGEIVQLQTEQPEIEAVGV
ncbi:hypothetical protein M413DRAFT_31988 [Hebeloma cylindrosporum]|uniref:HNH nuclease domain-containing protein n=1 Tax=Hebeloma cylindrosporum TaxID=76867 RepID=A0A0C2Y4Y5_HEBCY|nr:hypothetical protein M413DRAFT_31988 [Hebeloma cylindrosporum h7]